MTTTTHHSTGAAADLDRATPKWPEAVITLGSPPSVMISGVTTPLTHADVQAEAVALIAKQASAHGHPIRVRAVTDHWVQRMIVTADAQVTLLVNPPAPISEPRKGSRRPAKPITKTAAATSAGRFSSVPGWFKWAALGCTAVMLLAVAVMVFHRPSSPAAQGPPPAPPIPPAGDIYTETAPRGWTTHAAWVVPLADRAPDPVTDPGTGYTAAITPTDQQAPGLGPFNPDALFLSVLAADGHTVWATPLGAIPAYGPALAQIDGALTVAVVTGRTIQYWPLTGGDPTTVDLPSGTRVVPDTPGTSLLFNTDTTTAGYLHGGALQTVKVLPRTKPIAANDGTVLLYQDKADTWWKVSADTTPTRTDVTLKVAAAANPPKTPKPVDGELKPTGQGAGLLMVVSQNQLYALTKKK